MKYLPCLAAVLLTCALPSLAADKPAAAPGGLAVVDLKKVFDGYWKTKQADLNLKERASELDKKRKDMLDDLKKSGDEYKKLVESASDSAVSVEERDKPPRQGHRGLR